MYLRFCIQSKFSIRDHNVPGAEALQPRLPWRPGQLVHGEADIVPGPQQGQPLTGPCVQGELEGGRNWL